MFSIHNLRHSVRNPATAKGRRIGGAATPSNKFQLSNPVPSVPVFYCYPFYGVPGRISHGLPMVATRRQGSPL